MVVAVPEPMYEEKKRGPRLGLTLVLLIPDLSFFEKQDETI